MIIHLLLELISTDVIIRSPRRST